MKGSTNLIEEIVMRLQEDKYPKLPTWEEMQDDLLIEGDTARNRKIFHFIDRLLERFDIQIDKDVWEDIRSLLNKKHHLRRIIASKEGNIKTTVWLITLKDTDLILVYDNDLKCLVTTYPPKPYHYRSNVKLSFR